MGKGTDVDQQLSSRELAAAEIKARRAAVADAGAVLPTHDGELTTQAQPTAAPQVVRRQDPLPWD